jgi:hypothetical protein
MFSPFPTLPVPVPVGTPSQFQCHPRSLQPVLAVHLVSASSELNLTVQFSILLTLNPRQFLSSATLCLLLLLCPRVQQQLICCNVEETGAPSHPKKDCPQRRGGMGDSDQRTAQGGWGRVKRTQVRGESNLFGALASVWRTVTM